MNGEKLLFGEDAFGDVYGGTFFEEDFSRFRSEKPKDDIESEKLNAATARVRMSNDVDINREAARAFNTACSLSDLGGSAPATHFVINFSGGRIF